MKPVVKFTPDNSTGELTGYVDAYLVIEGQPYCMVVVNNHEIYDILPHKVRVIGRTISN